MNTDYIMIMKIFYINSKITAEQNANSFNNYFVNICKCFAQQLTRTIHQLTYINNNIHSIYIPDISKMKS